jgi:hypothetical protein
MEFMKQALALVLTCGLLIATSPVGANAVPQQSGEDQQSADLTAKEIDNLVAPIALYPDALVAQILSGATYPDQIVEADRFVQANAKLSPSDLMTKVNGQSWDPSVKALTQFPSVLDNMSQNLSWTSALGEASYYQQADVMASVQRLRKEAKAAGNLKTTSQQTVVQQDPQTIVIQPANPQVVYVPTYNPTVVYGTPYNPPGYSTAALVTTGVIAFGVGMAIGASMNNSCCGWGWNSWGCGWHGGNVVYQRNVYVSRSNVYANGNRYRYNGGNYRGGGNYNGARPTPYGTNRSGNRGTNVSGNTVNINNGNRNNVNGGNRNNVNNGNRNPNVNNRPANGNNRPGAGNNAATRPAPSADRGYAQKTSATPKTGAISGYGAGGNTRTQADRGRSSYGGGGGREAGQTRQAAPRASGGNRKR